MNQLSLLPIIALLQVIHLGINSIEPTIDLSEAANAQTEKGTLFESVIQEIQPTAKIDVRR